MTEPTQTGQPVSTPRGVVVAVGMEGTALCGGCRHGFLPRDAMPATCPFVVTLAILATREGRNFTTSDLFPIDEGPRADLRSDYAVAGTEATMWFAKAAFTEAISTAAPSSLSIEVITSPPYPHGRHFRK